MIKKLLHFNFAAYKLEMPILNEFCVIQCHCFIYDMFILIQALFLEYIIFKNSIKLNKKSMINWNYFPMFQSYPNNVFYYNYGDFPTYMMSNLSPAMENREEPQKNEEIHIKEEKLSDSEVRVKETNTIKRKKTKIQEQQYRPPCKINKKNEKSNLLKLFIRHVKKILTKKTDLLVNIARSNKCYDYDQTQFTKFFEGLFPTFKNYARPKKLKQIFQDDGTYNLIMRVLFSMFCKLQIYRIILRKNHMGKKKKIFSIKLCKTLQKELLGNQKSN